MIPALQIIYAAAVFGCYAPQAVARLDRICLGTRNRLLRTIIIVDVRILILIRFVIRILLNRLSDFERLTHVEIVARQAVCLLQLIKRHPEFLRNPPQAVTGNGRVSSVRGNARI